MPGTRRKREIKFTNEFAYVHECESRALPRGETGKSFNGEEIRDSRVSFEIHRDYWQRRKTFRAREREDELRRAIIQGNPYDFQFYHALRKPDHLFPRHYDSQVMPLLSSSKLMKIKLSRRVGNECPDIFELRNSQTWLRDLFSLGKTIKDPTNTYV